MGIDLAKSVFALVVLNQAGKVTKRKLIKRAQLLDFIARHDGAIAMEACGGAHPLGTNVSQDG